MSLKRFDREDVLLTFQEAAELLRVSRATMYRLLASGQLKGHKVGARWRFYKAELHAFIAGQDRQGAQDLPSESMDQPHGVPSRQPPDLEP
jgi:excisionase family DNA binding protein